MPAADLLTFLSSAIAAPLATHLAKRRGWPDELKRATCVLSGGACGAAAWLLQGMASGELSASILQGLIGGATAVAAYTVTKKRAKRRRAKGRRR